MTTVNPFVPPPVGAPSGSAAPVANAPSAPDTTKRETSRPVTAATRDEHARADEGRRPPESSRDEREPRGRHVDVTV